MSDPLDLLDRLDRIRAESLARFETLTQEQLDWRPPLQEAEQAWSLGEVFMHLAVDEHYLREQIARPLLEGVSPPEAIRFLPPPPPYGLKKDAIRFWFERARAMTRRLLENWPENARLDLKHDGGLEPMNALEWLAAYGGHESFHHRPIDALIERMAGREAAPA